MDKYLEIRKIFENFQRETGIQVLTSYYETNEEMLVKLEATNGGGYDLIMPSDYAVKHLIDRGILAKLDRSKLPFFKHLNKALLSQFFDKTNSYSVPFCAAVYGFGIDKKKFPNSIPNASWENIFNPEKAPSGIAMPNDIREIICMASKYLFNKIPDLTKKQIEQIKKLLKKQRVKVSAYSDLRADNLLASGNCSIAVTNETIIWYGIMHNANIDLLIPEDGTFTSIENLAMPKSTKVKELVYTLLNYLYKPTVMKQTTKLNALFPARPDVVEAIHKENPNSPIKFSDKQFKNSSFFRFDALTNEQVDEIWLDLKS